MRCGCCWRGCGIGGWKRRRDGEEKFSFGKSVEMEASGLAGLGERSELQIRERTAKVGRVFGRKTDGRGCASIDCGVHVRVSKMKKKKTGFGC
jgi:hypothetical protein